jgi:hypothetical protein
MLIAMLARLDDQSRLYGLPGRANDPAGLVAASRRAAADHGWVIVEGSWTVSSEPITTELVRPTPYGQDLDDGDVTVKALVPARRDDLLPTGRLRLTPDNRTEADVFGHIDGWDDSARSLAVIADAVFARVGDPRFEWKGASFGDNRNGDF